MWRQRLNDYSYDKRMLQSNKKEIRYQARVGGNDHLP